MVYFWALSSPRSLDDNYSTHFVCLKHYLTFCTWLQIQLNSSHGLKLLHITLVYINKSSILTQSTLIFSYTIAQACMCLHTWANCFQPLFWVHQGAGLCVSGQAKNFQTIEHKIVRKTPHLVWSVCPEPAWQTLWKVEIRSDFTPSCPWI